MNIWNRSLKDVSTTSCKNVEPFPDILNWSDLDKSTINGTNHERDIEELCHKSKTTFHQIVPVRLNLERAMATCKIMNAEMAYPSTSDQFKELQCKYLVKSKLLK